MAEAESKPSTTVEQADDARDVPPGYGLREFTVYIVDAARDGQSDPRLSGEERDLLIKHSKRLAAAVDFLTKPPRYVEPSHISVADAIASNERERVLWQALGSACLIASFQVANPLQLRKRCEGSERGVAGTRKKSQQRHEVLATLVDPILAARDDKPTSLIVRDIAEQYNKQLESLGQKTQKTDTIHRLVNSYRKNARSSG
jgi:hypothetical protein